MRSHMGMCLCPSRLSAVLVCLSAALALPAAPASGDRIGVNLLANPSFESPGLDGWNLYSGEYYRIDGGAPGQGQYYYYPGATAVSHIYQTFDLVNYVGCDVSRLDEWGYYVTYGGWQRSNDPTWPDGGLISVQWSGDPTFPLHHESDLGWQYHGGWGYHSGAAHLLVLEHDPWGPARHVGYSFRAVRHWGTYNDAALDGAHLEVRECDIWSRYTQPYFWGAGSRYYAGPLLDVGYGDLFITNQATLTTAVNSFVVGEVGPGQVRIREGGHLVTDNPPGANGAVYVSLGDSHYLPSEVHVQDGTWLANTAVFVGYNGNGKVTVYGGGQWTTNRAVKVGLTQSTEGDDHYAGIVLDGGVWNANATVNVGSGLLTQASSDTRRTEVVIRGGGAWTTALDVNVNGTSYDSDWTYPGKVILENGTWNALGEIRIAHDGPGEVHVAGGLWTTWGGVSVDGTVVRDSFATRYYYCPGKVSLGNAVWNAFGPVTVGGTNPGEVSINGTWTTFAAVSVDGAKWDDLTYLIQPVPGKVAVQSDGTWNALGPVTIGRTNPGEVSIHGTWTTTSSVSVDGVMWEDVQGKVWPKYGAVAVWGGGTWDATGPVRIGHAGPGCVNILGGKMSVAAGNLDIGPHGALGLQGGELCITSGDWHMPASPTFYFPSGLLTVHGRLTGLYPGLGAGRHVKLSGPAALCSVTDLTVYPGASIILDGGELEVASGGQARFDDALVFTDSGGTVRLVDGRLVHDAAPLELKGNLIAGSGEVVVGQAGIDLGTPAAPGRLTGQSDTSRLAVYGNVGGSGVLTNVDVHGRLSVGSSAGQVSLANVFLASGSSIAMEVHDVDEYDRLLVGAGVDFNGCPIEIAFAGGFIPDRSDSFDLFDPLAGADLSAALGTAAVHTPVDWQLDPSTGTLSYIPEPIAPALLALGGLALIRRRAR